MPNSIFDASPLRDEKAAYAYVEARIWPDGRVCPHCGVVDRSGPLKGKSTRIGVYKCYACRKPFTVKIGTIFEDSHVPMHLWLQAIVMMCGSKKGISSNQLYRMLGVTARLGRTITPEDDRPAAPPVAVISFKYWRSRFGSNPNVVGKRIQINSVPVTIVGVNPTSPAEKRLKSSKKVLNPPVVFLPCAS